MRAVVQRVSRASVIVDDDVVGCIDSEGLCVLVGTTHGDGTEQAEKLAAKILGLRILAGERSAEETGAALLVVSQFTLYADTRRGRRPSWSKAAPREVAEPLIDEFVAALRSRGARVETGVFGAHMSVSLTNEGPVTLIVEV
jgi:D-aminoacyl-tRNA deacylase